MATGTAIPTEYTVWPVILAGRYYGGLLKVRHLPEITLVVEQVLSYNDIHSKMNIECTGNLTVP